MPLINAYHSEIRTFKGFVMTEKNNHDEEQHRRREAEQGRRATRLKKIEVLANEIASGLNGIRQEDFATAIAEYLAKAPIVFVD